MKLPELRRNPPATELSHADRLLSEARRDLLRGGLIAGFLVFGVGTWAAATVLSGAVIAAGSVVVESKVKTVQHPTGGVIAEIAVKEGQSVAAGDLLVRLDETVAGANLAIVSQQCDELEFRSLRLRVESLAGSTLAPTPRVEERIATDPAAAAIWQGESNLFAARLAAREGQKSLLREQIGQLAEQMKGFTQQAEAKSQEITLIASESKGVEELFKKGLAPKTRLTALQREAVRISGEHGQLLSSIASGAGRRSELEAQILQIDQQFRSDASSELRDVEAKLAEARERRIAAQDQMKRLDIRAPVAGYAHELAFHTVGGVITPAEPILKIVPAQEGFTVMAKVATTDIDQVVATQPAMLRFSAFNQQMTPEVLGNVTQVAADVTVEPRSGASYYLVEIAPEPESLGVLKGMKLVSGMPVEVHIRTHDRTPLSYLTKPLSDQIQRAFRED
ncbi:MAG TPA: HlyD family type I secretion periplasmic adaptor subunit [Xanthobacteraceae bacterium]|nr:HlyD family type I secretion periplasmic adaptor subunit [Xanthobacteraceae bacterium]